jgi:hypothetical protein
MLKKSRGFKKEKKINNKYKNLYAIFLVIFVIAIVFLFMKTILGAESDFTYDVYENFDDSSLATGLGSGGNVTVPSADYAHGGTGSGKITSNAKASYFSYYLNLANFSTGFWVRTPATITPNNRYQFFILENSVGDWVIDSEFVNDGGYQFQVSNSINYLYVPASTSTWYWVTMQYLRNKNMSINIYNESHSLLGNYSFSAPNYNSGNMFLGPSWASVSSGTGYYDDWVMDTTDATFPLLEWETSSSDTTYPQFSSYFDDSASFNNSGTGRFNVTLANTNGTVWLEINGQNVTATNRSGSANIFNTTYTFFSAGVYPYKWYSWGNGTNHNYNVSNTQSYTVNGTVADTTLPAFTNLQNQTLNLGQSLNYDIDASDSSGIDSFYINWTNTFSIIPSTGVLTNISDLSIANYSVNVTVNDTLGNVNSAILVIRVINSSGGTSPTFSNYWMNNGSLIGSGVAYLNVTISNTNGIVILKRLKYSYFSNGTNVLVNDYNYTATNRSGNSNIFNVTLPLYFSGDYLFQWASYNSTGSGFNTSEIISYTVNSNQDVSVIADHNAVSNYTKIPKYYLNKINKLLVFYDGESHSGALIAGLLNLSDSSPLYNIDINDVSLIPPVYSGTSRLTKSYWTGSIWDNWMGEEHTWTNVAAINMVNTFIHKMNNVSDFNRPLDAAIIYGWCWDMSWINDVGGTVDPVYHTRWAGSTEGGVVNQRWGLDEGDRALTENNLTMLNYTLLVENLTQSNPNTTLIYQTGPTDGYTDENGYQNYLKNQFIRNWVRNGTTTRYLLDYNDILDYNASGLTTTTWTNNFDNNADYTYPYVSPDYLTNINPSYHISLSGAVRIAKAYWWLMGRVEGWDGTANPVVVLDKPVTNTTSYFVPLTFNATVSGIDGISSLKNCSLWHNATGTWDRDQTQIITGVLNTTSFNLIPPTSSFIWNIQCYDNNSNSGWGATNRTVTPNTTVIADTVYPQFSSYGSNNGTLNDSGISEFDVTLENTNGTVLLEINRQNITATNNLGNVFNANYTFSSAGIYSYKWHSWGNGTNHNYNVSKTQSYTVNGEVDTTYPIFSSYFDDSASLTGNGTGRFNVTLANTNGIVWLEINGQNITATNNLGNVFNANYTFSSAGIYSYKWHSWGNGTNHNYNVSNTQSYTVNAPVVDTIYPRFSSYWANNNSLTGNGTGTFNVTLTNTNGIVWLEINGQNITAANNSGSATIFNATYTFSSAGTYSYKWYSLGSGTDNNLNVSNAQSYTVNAPVVDTIYPRFSSYWANNARLVGSGIGTFNVTLTNTDGTVWLEINGQNITATNRSGSATRFNATYAFATNGTYSYRWHSWGRGPNHNYNVSNTKNYTVNNTKTCTYFGGNWSIDIADNCTIGNINLGNNTLIIGGTCGTLTVNGTVIAKQLQITTSGLNSCFSILMRPNATLLIRE